MGERQLREMPAGAPDIAERGDGGASPDAMAFDERDPASPASQEKRRRRTHQPAAQNNDIHVRDPHTPSAAAILSLPPERVKDAIGGIP